MEAPNSTQRLLGVFVITLFFLHVMIVYFYYTIIRAKTLKLRFHFDPFVPRPNFGQFHLENEPRH